MPRKADILLGKKQLSGIGTICRHRLLKWDCQTELCGNFNKWSRILPPSGGAFCGQWISALLRLEPIQKGRGTGRSSCQRITQNLEIGMEKGKENVSWTGLEPDASLFTYHRSVHMSCLALMVDFSNSQLVFAVAGCASQKHILPPGLFICVL